MAYTLKKIITNPLKFIKISFTKLFIAPFQYGRKNDYDAAKYWDDRFKKYGPSLTAVGDEGLSIEENKKMYAKAAETFTNIFKKQNFNTASLKTLEIGCGTGFYTNILKGLDVNDYTALDITDSFFPTLKENFSDYTFIKGDITSDKLPLSEKYDLIVMIDVMLHIVNRDKLGCAMQNIANMLSKNGHIILSPISPEGKKHLFNVHFWTKQDIKQYFPHHEFIEEIDFRGNKLVVIQSQN